MSSNVGLSTPRGSGTSGYVQKNHAHLRPRDNTAPYPRDWDALKKHKPRQPDAEILEHDRRRAIEVRVFELRDRLEDEGVEEDEIDAQTDALRKKLLEEEEGKGGKGKGRTDARGLKSHQVHELAKAKIEESEKLRKALGIREDYEEGSHWKRGEERLREGLKNEQG
ncbi:MAG: RNA-splicing factor [Bathelium mastoideum]|nr:MAG: RNA-splicing factor [Bathelium mastoideum]